MINDLTPQETGHEEEEKEMLIELKEERARIIKVFTNAKLTKRRRNEIFEIIVRYGFSPDDFIIDNIENNQSVHFYSIGFSFEEAPAYECSIGLDLRRPDEFMVIASPITNRIQASSKGDWDFAIKFFANWLATIKEDLKLEEKWNRLDIPDWEFEPSEGKFGKQELELINNKLDQLNIQLSNIDISEDVLEDLEEIIAELKEQSYSLSKINWQRLFVGAIINTIVKFSLPKENATLIWACIRNTFSKLL